MAGGSKRPVIVLAVLAVVVVLVFVVGVTFGGGDRGDGSGWRERLAGFGAGAPLTVDDVVAGSGCDVSSGQVVFSGSCTLDVPATGGRFSLGGATRRATLRNGPGPVTLLLTVEDREIDIQLDPGEEADVTVGRSGGTLVLACRGGFGCVVSLEPPS